MSNLPEVFPKNYQEVLPQIAQQAEAQAREAMRHISENTVPSAVLEQALQESADFVQQALTAPVYRNDYGWTYANIEAQSSAAREQIQAKLSELVRSPAAFGTPETNALICFEQCLPQTYMRSYGAFPPNSWASGLTQWRPNFL